MWLLEVFNVVYKGHVELKPDQLVGTIKVNDRLQDHYMYIGKAEKRKPSIKRLDEVVLSGPTGGSILGKDSLNFDVDLFRGEFKESFTVCDRSCDHSTSWPHKKNIVSKDGRGEIYILYAIYDNATEAHIKVRFFTIGRSRPKIYGVIAASTSEIEIPEYSTMLCIKKESEKIKVQSGKPFPLSRSVIAVPLGSVLSVDMHLVDGGKVLVEASVEFVPKMFGSEMKSFHDKDKKVRVEVEVTWRGSVHEPGRKEEEDWS